MYDPRSKEYSQTLFLKPIMDKKYIMIDEFYSLDGMWMIINIIQYGSNYKFICEKLEMMMNEFHPWMMTQGKWNVLFLYFVIKILIYMCFMFHFVLVERMSSMTHRALVALYVEVLTLFTNVTCKRWILVAKGHE